MPIYPCRKPPLTTTYPLAQAIIIARDLETLLNLQALDARPLTLDLGGPLDTTTLHITFLAPHTNLPLQLTVGNILVKEDNHFLSFPDLASFEAIYGLV